MFFEIHVTGVNDVTGLFFDEIFLFIGWRVWRLLKVSTFAMLEEKMPTSISEDTSLLPRPEQYQHEVRIEPGYFEKPLKVRT